MSKPDDIPQDVWDDAAASMARVGWYADSMIIGASRAILAERERCALVASSYGDCGYSCGEGISELIRGSR